MAELWLTFNERDLCTGGQIHFLQKQLIYPNIIYREVWNSVLEKNCSVIFWIFVNITLYNGVV